MGKLRIDSHAIRGFPNMVGMSKVDTPSGNFNSKRKPFVTWPIELEDYSNYTGAKKDWHPYYINTIEMRSF